VYGVPPGQSIPRKAVDSQFSSPGRSSGIDGDAQQPSTLCSGDGSVRHTHCAADRPGSLRLDSIRGLLHEKAPRQHEIPQLLTLRLRRENTRRRQVEQFKAAPGGGETRRLKERMGPAGSRRRGDAVNVGDHQLIR
jgi:hypothetical protein